ncbi:hypothetical protein R1sor_010815 [Riccia sorocarpa]|uniref:Uncharacterized protein n=1 Tax=Riccia sorocarpa TaxID=122646 RepID=A0ABD3I567_9MARC
MSSTMVCIPGQVVGGWRTPESQFPFGSPEVRARRTRCRSSLRGSSRWKECKLLYGSILSLVHNGDKFVGWDCAFCSSIREQVGYSRNVTRAAGVRPVGIQFDYGLRLTPSSRQILNFRKSRLVTPSIRRTSKPQVETSTDDFSRTPSLPSRNSGQNSDLEKSQGGARSIRSGSTSSQEGAPVKGRSRSSSSENDSRLPFPNSKLSTEQNFSPQLQRKFSSNTSSSSLSRSSKHSSRTPGNSSEATNSLLSRTSSEYPHYFKSDTASFKTQALQEDKNKRWKGGKFSRVLPSSVRRASSTGDSADSSTGEVSPSLSIDSQISHSSMLSRYSRNSPSLKSVQKSSARKSAVPSLSSKQLEVTVTNGKYPSSVSFKANDDMSVVRSSSNSSATSEVTASSVSDVAESLERGNIEAERADISLSSEHIASQTSSSGRRRKDSVAAMIGADSLDRLHQQLEDQAKGNSSKAILQKPLGAEEASRLKDRLSEQKRKGMQAIQQKLLRGRESAGQQEEEFSCSVDPDTLILGEYVVHKRVGIGKFIGLKFEAPPGKTKPAKYIYLKYADGIAKLRAKQAQRLLYRYHLPGETGRAPSLSKLKDPGTWEKRKSKGRVAVQKLVVNMMELYIHRLKQNRAPYPPVNPTSMAAFSAKFPHKPTPDQIQAFADVTRDMTERDLPMDRLICGDVGFGKTEVALRGILIAVLAGKQVMVLSPSTVLAKQHYETIRDRFDVFPGIKVALLCRFQKESEKKELIVGIHNGSLNIIIGTHALLGSQIRYSNLGLLVIDEEQRFGVKQKEKITCLKTTVDVLTLSATPIPRTLYLAMSGFRDASLLTTPPPERRPIRTHLLEYNQEVARKAIQFELERGGQVFYVVPRVKGIEDLQLFLQAQFPDIQVAIAHGKQSAASLEDAMEKFCGGETKILLCTNIVESGLDIRSVNTIIVEDVHLFGLAQLYQLRGRVGRAHREAHAYLFHPHKSLLTDEALERLVALEECCDLGQGFQLAERDMAIRGIGSLFGEQQSGDAAKIGIDLYFEMLLEGLSKVDNQRLPEVDYDSVQLELGLDIHIPSEYIRGSEEREQVWRAAERAAKESLRSLMIFTNRLRDTYGKEPVEMEMLLKTLYVRRMAADLGIHRIRTRGLSVIMETEMSPEAFEMIAASVTSESVLSSLTYGSGQIEMQGLIGLPQERQLERVFCCLVDMVNSLPSFVKYL